MGKVNLAATINPKSAIGVLLVKKIWNVTSETETTKAMLKKIVGARNKVVLQ